MTHHLTFDIVINNFMHITNNRRYIRLKSESQIGVGRRYWNIHNYDDRHSQITDIVMVADVRES